MYRSQKSLQCSLSNLYFWKIKELCSHGETIIGRERYVVETHRNIDMEAGNWAWVYLSLTEDYLI